MMINYKLSLTFVLATIFCCKINAQSFSMTGVGGTYLQDFNTLNTAGSVAWANNTNILNVYAQRTGTGTTIVADAGSGVAGNLYSYGSTAAADRAIGSLGSGNVAAGSFAYGVQLQNNTGSTITTMTVSYTGEQWRNSAVATPQVITLWYKIAATPITVLNPNASAANGWTQITGIDFSSPVNGGVAGLLDGNAAANRTALSGTISGFSIPVGEHIMIKWDDPDQTGTDHGLSIDDVSITWGTIAPCTPPVTQVTSFTSGILSNITANISWTAGSGTNSIVMVSANNPVSANPSNGIAYSASATYAAGSQIGTGNYVVYNGTGNAVTVSGLTASTTYYFSIYTFDPNSGSSCYNTISPATGNVTTTTAGVGSALQIQSILVDACAFTSNEPLSEMVRFKNGTLPLNIANISIAGGSNGVYQNNKWPNAAQAWHGLSQNPTTAYVTARFDSTILSNRCGVLLEPPAGVIPPGATVIMVCSQRPAVPLNDFSNLNDTVYMVYQTTVTDTVQGHFVNYNAATGLRHLVIKDNQNGFRDTVTYDRSFLVTPAGTPGQADGATVLFDDPGNATYINYDCSAPYVPFFVDAGANTATCFNAPVSLTANTSTQFNSITWSGGTGTFSTPNAVTTNYTPGVTETSGAFYLYATLQSYCSTFVMDSLLITINPAPSPVVTANITSATICSGSPITLTAAGGTSYLWSTTATTNTVTVSPTTSTVYTVNVTNACSTTQGTFSVTVNDLPIVVASNTGAYCVRDSIHLSATAGLTYSWTGPNSFASTLQNPSIPNSTSANAGVYSLTVTDANTCQNTTTTNVVVNALPTFNQSLIVNTPANCGSTDGGIVGVGVNGTDGANYNYDWIAPDSTILVTTPDSVLTGVAGGIYYLAATEIATGCRDSVSFTINTLGGPIQPTFTLTTVTSVCEGSNFTLSIDPLSATPGATYNWSIPGAAPQSGVDLTSIPMIGLTAANQGVYSVVVVGVGCNNNGSISITVNPLPNPTINGVTHFCLGQNTILSASSINTSGNTYQWLLNGNPIAGANSATYTATQAGDYQVSATASTMCNATSALTAITVDALPVITTVSTTSAGCGMNNGAITGTTVTSTPTITYQWTDGAGNGLSTNADITNLNAGNYTFIATDGNGCVDSAHYVINSPSAPIQPSSSVHPTACEGTNFSLGIDAASTTNGAVYTWVLAGNIVQTGVNSTSLPVIGADASNVGLYTVYVTVDACVDSTTAFANIHILPNPSITSSTTSFCAGDSIVLVANQQVGLTYSWFNNLVILAVTNDSLVVNQAGNYQVLVSDGVCDSLSDNYAVTVNTLPTISVNSGSACINSSAVQLTATGAQTYSWTAGTSSSTGDVVTVSTATAGLTTYTVTGTDLNGCNDTSVATVTIYANPIITINALQNGNIIACSGVDTTLTAGGANSYVWSTSQIINPITYSTTLAATITVIGTDINGCVDSTKVSFVPAAGPSMPSITGLPTICNGYATQLFVDSINGYTYSWINSLGNVLSTDTVVNISTAGTYSLSVSNSCGTSTQAITIGAANIAVSFVSDENLGLAPLHVEFTNNSTGADSYYWIFGNGDTLSTTNLIHPNLHQHYENPGTYTVYLLGVNSTNYCSQSATMEIIVLAQEIGITIPNVFSPNGDLINDFFGVESYGIKEFSCAIYNRWGSLIVELNNLNEKWTPATNVSEGTYFYMIKAKGIDEKDYSKEGYLLLVR